jgi:hypothetical protein
MLFFIKQQKKISYRIVHYFSRPKLELIGDVLIVVVIIKLGNQSALLVETPNQSKEVTKT